MSACTAIGAISAGADKQAIEAMKKFGENIGYAFQIRDDIFDYYKESNIGKPTGNDIREGKVTLPLLYALKQESVKAGTMLEIVLTKDFTDEHIDQLILFAKEQGGIEYAKKRMTDFRNEAVRALDIFPNSPSRRALIDLADYIILRDK